MRRIFFKGVAGVSPASCISCRSFAAILLILFIFYSENLNGKLPADFARETSWAYLKNLSPSPVSAVESLSLLL
jgi:hypothetical protein